MNPTQRQWLVEIARRIPGLFAKIEQGDTRAETTLGEQVINGRRVRLYFVVEVLDTGSNPLGSHASVNYPATHTATVPDMPELKSRRRNRPKRW